MLHTKEIGGGDRTYIALHGWNGTVDTFDPLASYLPEDIRVIAVDLPGYGRSSAPSSWELPAVGEQIIDTLDNNGIGTFDILASCSGAFPGFFAARQAGESRIGRFVWLEPFAYIPWYLRLFLLPAVGWGTYWLTFGTSLGRRLTNAALADQRQSGTNMLATFERSPLDVPYRYLSLFDRLPAAAHFSDVPGEKRLVHGDTTFRAVRDSVQQWREVWPSASAATIDDAGHLPIEEAPASVADQL
jgi:pimeloyl-ACP methyl ester carboxylesterase